MPQFRTKDERTRSLWAGKFMSVSEGKLYTSEKDEHSPFPIHKYFGNKLLGDKIKMLELNAGEALVEHFVADTLTEMKIKIGEDESSPEEQQILDWFTEIDFDAKLDEAARSFYGAGYGAMQLFRTLEDDENGFTVSTLDPSTWYPDIPTFDWQKVTSGRVISVFSEEDKNQKLQWYAFVEKHEPAKLTYQLIQLEHQDSLEGKIVDLSKLERFKGLDKEVAPDLDFIPIFQADRQKSSRHVCGTSLLYPIWDLLQEVSETQTQIRQERIKHLRAKLAAPMRSLQGIERDRVDTPQNSKERQAALQTQARLYDVNQEIYPVPEGATVLPQYITRDLESITKGLELIDSLLSKAASIVGAPRSIFNLDEQGDIHVDTEKRKDRRYVRKVIQGQKRIGTLVEEIVKAYWQWSGETEELDIKVSFDSPFNLTQQELVDLAKSMNPTATLLSEEDAVNMVHAGKTPEERGEMLEKIRSEKKQSELERPTEFTL